MEAWLRWWFPPVDLPRVLDYINSPGKYHDAMEDPAKERCQRG